MTLQYSRDVFMFLRHVSRGFITGRWVFQTYPVSEFDPDEVAQKMRKHVPENDAAEDVALFGDE